LQKIPIGALFSFSLVTKCITKSIFLNKQNFVRSFIFSNFKANDEDFWERSKNAEVTVAMIEEEIEFTGTNPEVLCYYHDGVLNEYYTLITCKQPMRGSFVQILFNAATSLNMYEVEVHGM